ncbi:hypothetical protein [Streptomyces olivochromogenes]|uniref:hypothetical protein n=1 Tax=Streptomyces olivochromogenes TaxID=1963 RepID=UPI001F41A84A|nr:hypothetical protein [Streptomyces olivochromogenes]MCF3135628.1 hypothetical protein [Streptomyces olivochromogenes]
MRIDKTVMPVLLAGALLGTLSGCGSDGGATGGDSAHGGGTGGTSGVPLKSKIAAPAAFDSAKGWEAEADWLPQGQPLPYAVSGKGDLVAYLDKTEQGYVLNVRVASSGKVLSTSKPWKGPKLTEDQSDEQSGDLAVPQIALIPGTKRDYFAVWARGQARKDALHEYKEVISVAFYPADASGKDLSPVGAGNAEAPDGEFDRPSVFPGPAGLVVTSYGGDSILLSPDGKVTDTSDARVTLNGKAVDPDYLMSFQGPEGLVTNGDEGAGGDGGFGADGGWQSTKAAPPGVEAVRREENVGFGMEETPNGRIVGAAGNYVIANWIKGAGGISAVHDIATGAVKATAPCRTEQTEYDADVPSPKNLAEVQPALSPNGRYLVKGGNVFDLETGRGTCTDSGEGAKKITLEAVGDDGTAYGEAGEDMPRTPVSISVTTGAAKPLPEATSTPNAITKGAGVFVTYAGTDSMHLIVLDLKS